MILNGYGPSRWVPRYQDSSKMTKANKNTKIWIGQESETPKNAP